MKVNIFCLFVVVMATMSCEGTKDHKKKCINNILVNPFKNCTPTTNENLVHNPLCNKVFRIAVKDLKPYTQRFRSKTFKTLHLPKDLEVRQIQNLRDGSKFIRYPGRDHRQGANTFFD